MSMTVYFSDGHNVVFANGAMFGAYSPDPGSFAYVQDSVGTVVSIVNLGLVEYATLG